jgi:hypothetical protein
MSIQEYDDGLKNERERERERDREREIGRERERMEAGLN